MSDPSAFQHAVCLLRFLRRLQVKDWFVSQIVDPDVLQSTKIDVNCMAEIVAQTGATVDSFESFFYKEEEHQKTVVDVGVLRFPDIEHPYFKVTCLFLLLFNKKNGADFAPDLPHPTPRVVRR